ncbi:MAG TPA: BON domain-containing protein [Blastocatellia bacterium]|nr:BON domain-containing protein [Blastocatellia bacterium]
MANDYDYDYRRGRNEREYYNEPYYRSQGGGDEEPYYRGYGGGERARYGHGRGRYYSEPYRRGNRGRDYGEPYGAYDYDRYEYGDRAREPYYQRRPEGESRETYYRGGYGRGAEERGFIERAGDEIKSWFGDEEAERRRRADEMRRGMYVGRGPRGYQRSDERIREDINDRLTDDAYVDASDIEVIVNNCMVTLMGRVSSREEKRRTEDIAESVSGVADVSNQLRVGQSAAVSTEPEMAPPPRARTAGT